MERSVYTQRTQTDQFEFVANRFHGVLSKEVSRQVVSVMDGGRLGIATGTLLSDTGTLTREAQGLCKLSRQVEYRFPTEGSTQLEPRHGAVAALSAEQIVEMCETIVDAVSKRYPEVKVDVTARRTRSELAYENSHAVRHRGEEWFLTYVVSVHRPSEEDLFAEYELFDQAIHDEAGAARLERFVEQLAQQFPIAELRGGDYPAVVHARNIEPFLTGFWQALDGRRLFEKQSPLRDRIGERLFDARFSLAVDPLLLGTGGFDVEGVTARRLELVEQGVLKDAFYDLEYGPKCGHPASGLATGNLRSRFQTDPVCIPFGETPLEALLAQAGRGVLIQHCHEVSRTTNLKGDFSCGLDALYFEEGRIRGRIKNLNMSANVFDLFRDGLEALSSEGQSSAVLGAQAPHMLFSAISFTV
jgi:PmbA protein